MQFLNKKLLPLAIAAACAVPGVSNAALWGALDITSGGTTVNYVLDTNFSTAGQSGFTDLGEVTGLLGMASNVGCNNSDYASSLAGKIVLIARGTCTFTQKIVTAQNHGAIGVLIYNNLANGLVSPAITSATTIPMLFLSNSLGNLLRNELNAGTTITVHMDVENSAPTPPTPSVPEPGTLLLSLLGLTAAARAARKFA